MYGNHITKCFDSELPELTGCMHYSIRRRGLIQLGDWFEWSRLQVIDYSKQPVWQKLLSATYGICFTDASICVECCCTSHQRHSEVWPMTVTSHAPGVTLALHSWVSQFYKPWFTDVCLASRWCTWWSQ